MNIFSKMRITHKIIALMVGLVVGFIAIGVTYYIQVNISDAARNKEKDAFIYQQKLSELKQLELNLRFQSNEIENQSSNSARDRISALNAALSVKINEAKGLAKSSESLKNIGVFQKQLGEYNNTLNTKIEALTSIRSEQTVSTRSEIETAFRSIQSQIDKLGSINISTNFAVLRESITDYLNLSTEVNRARIEDNMAIVNESFAIEETLDLIPTKRVELLQNVEILSGRALALVDELYEINANLNQQQGELEALVNGLIEQAEAALAASVEKASEVNQATQAAVTAIIFFVAMGAAIGIYLIYKSIVFPMAHMQNVIGKINRGKTKARVKVLSNDELADLGIAFNTLFDERIQQLETQSKENERLNNSIIALIQALGAIAKKDLTVKVPVSSDITGTISDAVNLLTSETANTLHEVKAVSREVNETSGILQDQSGRVMQIAESERMQVIATSKALRVLATAMTEVANQSEQADKSASAAIESTQHAKKAVGETVAGIRTIRETISETEKRTKRLGDRSQEISGIVNLINTIAERTHILALNASMHAASAGEAGKGFAVVAEEVQRLAESARQSTDEISAMVNNMRVETSDTVNIMNKLISQVAEGSKLAERSGKEMEVTENATRELVSIVKRIATEAVQQASIANRVNDRATIIRNFTDKTEKQLKEQKVYTDNLRKYAEALVDRVNVFKLPQDNVASTPDGSASNISPIKSAV